jgi:predicted nucleic acid-binding protein
MSFVLSGSVVLDSSVIIKWFQKYEALQKHALMIRQAYLKGKLKIYVPDLLIYEIGNVLRYKPDMNEITVQKALQNLYNMKISIEHIDIMRIRRSIQIAYFYNVTVYDAVFVTLTEQLESNFITDDMKLVQRLCGIPYVYHLKDVIPIL